MLQRPVGLAGSDFFAGLPQPDQSFFQFNPGSTDNSVLLS